uniref:Uncharacterized protein n=1 Tax=Arundo donax TaxID=35708 RepID=A0A0A9CS21_ARUDO
MQLYERKIRTNKNNRNKSTKGNALTRIEQSNQELQSKP